jgi:hypothetical protein
MASFRLHKLSSSFVVLSVLLAASNCVLDRNFERELELRPGTGDFKYELLLRGHLGVEGTPTIHSIGQKRSGSSCIGSTLPFFLAVLLQRIWF